MSGNDQARVGALLRESFGSLVAELGDGSCAVQVPGCAAPVVVTTNSCGDKDLLQVYTVVRDHVDWATEGLGDFLLRENRQLAYGRFMRCADKIAVEYNLFADGATAEQLASVVIAMALTASEVQVPLHLMGAVTTPAGVHDAG